MIPSIAPNAPYNGDDFYCDKALSGEQSVEKVVETDTVLAFKHTRPYWPVHIVVIPKQHISSLLILENPTHQLILMEMVQVIQQVAQQVIAEHGAAGVLTNLGNYQDSKHLHWHVHFGQPLR